MGKGGDYVETSLKLWMVEEEEALNLSGFVFGVEKSYFRFFLQRCCDYLYCLVELRKRMSHRNHLN